MMMVVMVVMIVVVAMVATVMAAVMAVMTISVTIVRKSEPPQPMAVFIISRRMKPRIGVRPPCLLRDSRWRCGDAQRQDANERANAQSAFGHEQFLFLNA